MTVYPLQRLYFKHKRVKISEFGSTTKTASREERLLLVGRQVPRIIPRLLLVRRHPRVADAARADSDTAVVAFWRFEYGFQCLKFSIYTLHALETKV